VLPHLRVGNAQPDLLLLVIGAWSLRRGVEEAIVWAFIGGVFLDLLSSGPSAAPLFAMLAAGLVLGVDPSTGLTRRQTQAVGDGPLALIVGAVLGTVIYHLVLLTGVQLSGYPVEWVESVARVMAPHLVYNLVLMPFVFIGLGWLDRRTRREEFAL
jgi:rod shape-determining protein MreD